MNILEVLAWAFLGGSATMLVAYFSVHRLSFWLTVKSAGLFIVASFVTKIVQFVTITI